jgi:hypothetical protein
VNSPKTKLGPKQKEKLLRNIWLLHDGRWFLKSVEQFGFDGATKLNLAVVKSIARTEIKQLLAETNFGEVKNMRDLQTLMEIAAVLYFPEEHRYEFKIVDSNTFVGYVLECYVHKMVSRAGTAAIHQCAAKLRFDSWCQAMGLDGEVINEKDTNNCNGTCEILFKIRW